MRLLSSISPLCLLAGILALSRPADLHAQSDTIPPDRYGDPFSDPGTRSPFDLYPSDYKYEGELDPDMRTFEIRERVGDLETRPPSTMTFEEFAEWKRRKMVEDYWRERATKDVDDKREEEVVNDFVFAKKSPTGDTLVEIRPSGSVTLDFGGRWQRVDNPAIPVRQQRVGGFEFDQQISMNVLGVVGERLRITANWDTKAVFDFDNNVKIEYQGKEEDILQSIEAGNVSMPIRNSLVRGGQNLFGVKAELRFGRLYVTTLLSNQRGKTESIYLRGGAQQREFEIPVNEYDDNRHFLLSQYFHDVFAQAFRNNPTAPNSQVRITRMEVYITNRNNTTNNLRNVVGLLDLGENNAARIQNDALVTPIGGAPVAHNGANTLYGQVTGLTGFRDVDQTVATLQGAGYASGSDFELIRSARKLDPARDYTFHTELGYLSLTTKLKNDEGIAVAFEFTYAGQQYKVGELSEDYQNLDPNQVVVLKLLKPQSVRTDLLSWNLMMKNIYTLNTTSVQQDGFQLRVIYKDDLTGIDNPTLQEGLRIKDVPLVRVFGLDKLNPNGDFLPDGNFDWIAGATIVPDRGLVIFPKLEPFGNDLVVSSASSELGLISGTEAGLIDKYTFTELYSTTKSDALQAASKSKFFLTGVFQSASTADILLPGINIAPGSVVVTAGSITLKEGVDFTVDYNLGRVRILNQGALASGKEIRIQFERADLFNFRVKSLMGARFDYKVNRELTLGATIMHMNERPLITRVNIGDEPIKNTQIGLDLNYESESRLLTRAVDKLPGIQTKEESKVQVNWEGAALIPGANKVLGDGGTSYLDDFEGAETPYDLTRNPARWMMGSTPQRFPEANSQNLNYSFRRAKMSWYNIDNSFYSGGSGNNSISAPAEDLQNHFTRPIGVNEVFPNRDQGAVIVNQTTLDIAYFPAERGPYNYQDSPAALNPNGLFSNPQENWSSMTRAIGFDTDFDNANIEFIEFWLMDPFMVSGSGNNIVRDGNPNTADVPNTTGGVLYFNLGNVSEDVLPDGVHAFENGLPNNTQATSWGQVTTEQFITPAFDNSRDRGSQDVGLDGLSNVAEQDFFSTFLGNVSGFLNPGALDQLQADPSSDNYTHYRTSQGDNRPIIERYRDQAGLENNSPINSGGQFPQASKTTPDNEDLNQDNTINQTESYFEYRVNLQPGLGASNHPYIVDQVTNTVNGDQVTWYQFRIPIREIDNVNASAVNGISDFKTIKFVRAYLTGWSQPVVLRMAQLQVVGAQWRRFTDDLSEPGVVLPPESSGSGFTIGTVNIEENGGGSATSSPYVIPPGVVRDVDNTSQVTRQINEQSLRLSVADLRDGDARAVFKNVAYDLLMYGKVRMFVHAERNGDLSTGDGEVRAFLRLGTDFTENYYEIEVPLEFSNVASADPEEVWRRANEINVPLEELVDTKVERNRQNFDKQLRFQRNYDRYILTVVGNPDLTSVRTMLIGIRNPRDDGQDKSATIWVNELRVADFNKDPGFATRGTVTAQLADLGTFVATGSLVTPNYGDIESRISERTRELTATYGLQTSLNMEKFWGEEVGLRLPLYASYDKEIVKPKYNPLDKDVELDKSLDAISDPQQREAFEEKVIYERTARSINMTGVQKTRVNPEAKPRIYDVENLTLSAGYSEERSGGIGGGDAAYGNNVQSRIYQQWSGTVAYAFNAKGLNLKPFAKSEGLKGKYLRPVKDFNINPLPINYTLRANLDRRYTRTQLYNSNFTTEGVEPQYEKSFWFNRSYGLRWNLTESIKVNFNAEARAIVDEPEGNRQDYRDTVWSQLWGGGRLKQYTQSVDVTYRLPFSKLPLTQWIDGDVNYNAGYNWTAAALGLQDTLGTPLGNRVDNSRQIKLQGRLNLQRLYTTVPFIRRIQTPPPPPKPGPKAPADTATTREGPSGLAKFTVNLLTMLKTVNGSYSITQSTLLPGFLPTPNYFGLDNQSGAPGLAFTLGSQNGSQIQEDAVAGGWITTSTQLNEPFTQARTRDLNLRANAEPLRDLRIQIDAKQKLANTYQETFRFDDLSGEFQSFSPTQGGSLQRSLISIGTAFERSGPNNTSSSFSNLEAYRDIVRARLNEENPNPGTYGRNTQSVLIPAFLAAYTGKSPTEVSLDPYPNTPAPNWRVDYAGLSRIKAVQKVFTSVNLTHSYTSLYDITSYTSSLAYDGSLVNPNIDLVNAPLPSDTNGAGEFIPVFIIEQVRITERFAPLIGVNMRLRNKMTLKLEYQRDRTVSLNVSNAQVTELRNQGVVVGVGWTKAGVKLPFGRPGNQIVLENDLSFKTDVTIRETVTYQRTLDGPAVVTAGNLNFQLRPTLAYAVNRRVNLQLYFERTINAPRISSAFRRTTTAFGVQLRFSLN